MVNSDSACHRFMLTIGLSPLTAAGPDRQSEKDKLVDVLAFGKETAEAKAVRYLRSLV